MIAWTFILVGVAISLFSPVLGAITMFPGIVIKLGEHLGRRGPNG